MADENIITPEIDFTKIDLNLITSKFADAPEVANLILKGLEKGAAAAKIQAANTQFGEYKKTSEAKITELETKIQEANSKGSKVSEAQENALMVELKAVKEEVRVEKERAAKIEAANANTSLQNQVITASTSEKFPLKAVNPKHVFALMKEDGLIGLENGNPYFHKMVDGKPVATNIEDSIQVYLNENKHLAAGSNVAGPGRTHSNSAGASTNGLLSPQQLRDALSKI